MTMTTNKKFLEQITQMADMYKLPQHKVPTLPADVASRLAKFKITLSEEVDEIDDIIALVNTTTLNNLDETDEQAKHRKNLEVMTAVADLLGDVIVYCRSEALKYGIPLEAVLGTIMDSNASKLGADGLPIYNENGKFMKGPNYYKPEPMITKLLQVCGGVTQGTW